MKKKAAKSARKASDAKETRKLKSLAPSKTTNVTGGRFPTRHQANIKFNG